MTSKKKQCVRNSKKCVFCKQNTTDQLNLGGLKYLKRLQAHYYCLLFSDTIDQSGEDYQGILGFMAKDIIKELHRSKDKRCCYCKDSLATLGCVYKQCRRKFHLPCGLANNTLHNFNTFKSHCHSHRKPSNVPSHIKASLNNYHCVICLESFDENTKISNIIWANCCKSSIIFHIECIKQLALNAGYFTKCPGCNNDKEFITTIKSYGVFVPEMDASWERERNAFSELLYVHSTCDVPNCLCPEGRNYSTEHGEWNIVLCVLCGSFGTHLACSNFKKTFECADCTISNNSKEATLNANNHIQHTESMRMETDIETNENDIDINDDLNPDIEYCASHSLPENEIVKENTSEIDNQPLVVEKFIASKTSLPDIEETMILNENIEKLNTEDNFGLGKISRNINAQNRSKHITLLTKNCRVCGVSFDIKFCKHSLKLNNLMEVVDNVFEKYGNKNNKNLFTWHQHNDKNSSDDKHEISLMNPKEEFIVYKISIHSENEIEFISCSNLNVNIQNSLNFSIKENNSITQNNENKAGSSNDTESDLKNISNNCSLFSFKHHEEQQFPKYHPKIVKINFKNRFENQSTRDRYKHLKI